DWVSSAGTVFRWTGSWLTVFTTADPKGRTGLSAAERAALVILLNRYRLAGYESYAPTPQYIAVDLIVDVCAQPNAFRSDLEAELLRRLGTGRLEDGSPAFFFPDQFTFGTVLEPSRLEAAIQATPGVAGVLSLRYRERSRSSFQELSETPLAIGAHQILRVDNDPNRPDMGSLRVHVEGGRLARRPFVPAESLICRLRRTTRLGDRSSIIGPRILSVCGMLSCIRSMAKCSWLATGGQVGMETWASR